MVTVMGTKNMPGPSEKPGGREAALSTTIATLGTVGGGVGIGVSHERNGIACKSNMHIRNTQRYAEGFFQGKMRAFSPSSLRQAQDRL